MSHHRLKHAGAALIGASALTVAGLLPAAMGTASAASAAKPPMALKSVKVFDQGTIDTTFSNPVDPAKLKVEQFQAPHYFWVIPHTHIAVAFRLLNGNHTVRTVLDRSLHAINARCKASALTVDPRCSTDTLDWEVVGVTDTYGQTLTNKDWKVWTAPNGAKKHPGACRPGCK